MKHTRLSPGYFSRSETSWQGRNFFVYPFYQSKVIGADLKVAEAANFLSPGVNQRSQPQGLVYLTHLQVLEIGEGAS